MKKLFSIFAVIACAVTLMVSCSSSQSTPTSTVEAYMKALQNGDYEGVSALFYFNPESKKAMKMKEGFSGLMTEKVKPEMEKLGGIASYEIGEESINEDGTKAVVPVKITYGNDTSNDQKTKLVFVEEKWYLDLGK